MKQALPAAARGKPLEIWFQDEARIGQKGTLTRIWARLGSRPPGPRDSRYEWAYIFAAVCPERATGAALVMPYANTEAMNLHLQEISRGVAPGAHAALIFDGAGWHTTDKLELPENITPVCLPPYAPELNPTENIWEYLRKNYLALRVFDDYDANRRRLLHGLERSPHHARSTRLHHPTKMGQGVMNYVGWYDRAPGWVPFFFLAMRRHQNRSLPASHSASTPTNRTPLPPMM